VKKVALALALLVATAAPAFASGTGSADLLKLFRAQLPAAKKAGVPVLLPDSMPIAGKAPKLYATGGAQAKGWDLELAAARNCGGANACFIASFEAKRGGKLPGKANLKLTGGDPAKYSPISCGASCSPASLWFTHAGVLYTWQWKAPPPKGTKTLMAHAADQAIAAGPR
jgi:hypothetical protein